MDLAFVFCYDLEAHPEFGGLNFADGNPRVFVYARLPQAHADRSYWGIAGFGLIVPLVFGMASGLWGNVVTRVLAWAALLSILALAFALDYEAWHGRRLLTTAWVCVPCVAWTFERLWHTNATTRWLKKVTTFYVTTLLGLVCVSALSAVFFASPSSLYPRDQYSLWNVANFSWQNGALRSDRIALLMRNRREYLDAVRAFETRVPQNAIVATDLAPDSFEYPLFGERLTRTILPLNSFLFGMQPLPSTAEYFLYARRERNVKARDQHLGADWYVRQLK